MGHFYFLTLKTLCLMLVLIAFPMGGTFAQDNPEPAAEEQQQEQPPEDDLSNIPDEYIFEANEFHDYCLSKPQLKNHYNCKCMALKYLDQRIESGPAKNKSSIMMDIRGECTDLTEAAGYQYQHCMANAVLMPSEIPPETFCECYANTYAKLFKLYKVSPSSTVSVKLETQAMISCQNPELAQRLYSVQIQ